MDEVDFFTLPSYLFYPCSHLVHYFGKKRTTLVAFKSNKITLSFGASNSSSFATPFTMSSNLSMQKPKTVGDSYFKNYFQNPLKAFSWHLTCSYNCAMATNSNGMLISTILVQTSLLGTLSKPFLKKATIECFSL